MSRKDTVLLAALINTMLLSVLFLTASREEEIELLPVALEPTSVPELAVEPAPPEPSIFTYQEQVASKEPIEEYIEVTVKRGDFLEKIARNYGVSVADIQRMNHLENDRLSVGQLLLVPKGRTVKEGAVENPISTEGETDYYVVAPGDNPWNIARQHNVNFDELLRLNDLDESKARNLKPGDRLRVK